MSSSIARRHSSCLSAQLRNGQAAHLQVTFALTALPLQRRSITAQLLLLLVAVRRVQVVMPASTRMI